MSKGTSTSSSTDEVDDTTLESESLSTAQETIPLPLPAGEVLIAGRYGSPIYGQYAQQAKSERSSKK